MAGVFTFFFVACLVVSRAEDLRDFEFERDPDEVMIAQESRHYQTIVKPPVRIVKPTGVTNSHRPQYNLDSLENESLEDFFEPTSVRTVVKNYKSSSRIRAKEGMVKDAVLRAMERKDNVGKFAQILPIIRAMSGSQRLALASLVANQVTTPPGRAPLNLAQVRSMFGSTPNTTDLMLPILLDMANLIRRAVRPGKEIREVIQPYPPLFRRHTEDTDVKFTNTRQHFERHNGDVNLPSRLLMRSHAEETNDDVRKIDDDSKPPSALLKKPHNVKHISESPTPHILRRSYNEDIEDDLFDIGVEPAPYLSSEESSIIPQMQINNIPTPTDKDTNNTKQVNIRENSKITTEVDNRNFTKPSSTTTEGPTPAMKSKPDNISRSMTVDNGTLDLMADSTNQTLAQDLPVAEKLRALNRYVDRKGNLIRRGTYPPKPYTASVTRRTTVEPGAVSRRRPAPARKLPASTTETKCELFTNTLCLHTDDYPTEAIVQSIRRNKAAAGALLADFKDPGEGALDGVSAAQESKYTADHYLISNRRGDTANRDFASAGEAGFMCPSTVKYARPQRARATSGQWKYIVNTGEHTQTLRLEKCLKPKDSCTYLTDNFKSKCVQVYNYHRLLTWDQQNGLHMDIFKVPTCCSCHIEGYSVSFPPLGHRIHETSSEHFPGEDLSSETGNHAFEAVQSSIQRPTIIKSPPFTHSKPESFPPFTDNNQNLISVSPFNKGKLSDNDDTGLANSNPIDSYSNSYFPDSFNQASSVRNVRRPLSGRSPTSNNPDSVTLPSYLEPPTPSASNSFSFVKEPSSKFKSPNIGSPFKRGAFRPSRRPIRKKISGGPDDLMPAGSSTLEAFTSSNMETVENFDEYLEEPQIGQASVITNTHHQINHPIPSRIRPTIGPKLQAVVTTEKISTTSKPQDQKINVNENFTSNGKRINYNYHPIIDFFGENEKESEDESIDREDSGSYVAPIESEWKPMNHPSRSSSLVGRKKHR